MKLIILLMLSLCLISPNAHAGDTVATSGRLGLRGVEALHGDSVKENPSAAGRIKLDADLSTWKFHSWLEGEWDRAVKRPAQDRALFKTFDQVYQSNTPYLEFKELYLSRSWNNLDLKAGIQRFAWGRLDEYPPNDLLNPWDYSQFLRKPLEDRKIGVPSISVSLNKGDWAWDMVWVPVFVPYRLARPEERWSGMSGSSSFSQLPNAELAPAQFELPEHTIENSAAGLRIRHGGDIEWAVNLFHGYDPKPVFKSTAFVIDPRPGALVIDPGYVPDFHRISVIGLDAAAVKGDWSLRMEAAYTFGRHLNIRHELWGYPALPVPGVYPLNAIEQKHGAIDYGIGADYRLFEDGTLFLQALQTVILGSTSLLYERKAESLLSASLKVFWMNQKVETNLNVACNPEHGDSMGKANARYLFSDSWKAGITAITLTGPSQSMLGRYSRNDQAEAELEYSW